MLSRLLPLALTLLALVAGMPARAMLPDAGLLLPPVLPAVPTAAEAPVALLVDLGSGQVLHARRPDARFMPASVTKVMTLYLAFELISQRRLDPAQVFTMSPAIARDWRR
ncbi:serine hydrolase, partial [Erythrobacter donghaensis]